MTCLSADERFPKKLNMLSDAPEKIFYRGNIEIINNNKCVAVMPCGLEQIQPKSNQYIADAILENGGCIISEYPEGTSLQKYNYVKRDRIQSGISDSVIIIEAEEWNDAYSKAILSGAESEKSALLFIFKGKLIIISHFYSFVLKRSRIARSRFATCFFVSEECTIYV